MQDQGRSIVWRAVAQVLREYGARGEIGTMERPVFHVRRDPDWIPGDGEEVLEDQGARLEAFR